MKQRRISDIVYEAALAPKKADKIAVLRRWNSVPLKSYLAMAIDKNLKWELPEGAPPYKPSNDPDSETLLYKELRRMYIFFKGGNPNLSSARREMLFVQLLESLDSKDAEFLVNVIKDKKLPKGLSRQVIDEYLKSA